MYHSSKLLNKVYLTKEVVKISNSKTNCIQLNRLNLLKMEMAFQILHRITRITLTIRRKNSLSIMLIIFSPLHTFPTQKWGRNLKDREKINLI